MKIGIRFGGRGNGYNDIFYLIHSLQHGKIKEVFTESVGSEIEYQHNNYIFVGGELSDDCDIKIFATHNTYLISSCVNSEEEYINIKEKYDAIVLSSPGEALVAEISDEALKKFLDDGNFYITGSTHIPFEHPNLFIDKFMGPMFLYYQLGLNYINFYKNGKTKNNLVGTYHRAQYINDSAKTLPSKKSVSRNSVIEDIRRILNDDLTIYENNHTLHPEILEPYFSLGLWVTNHTSGYSDYTTSVCNLIFESFSPSEDAPRASLSEKTTKAIIFSNENIFFMWHGPDDLFIYLKSLGFWFLNMEFYDFKNPSNNEITMSIRRTTEYLKTLKQQFKTNDKVFEHLYEKYSDKLSMNYSKFREKLTDISIGQNILTSLYNLHRGKHEV